MVKDVEEVGVAEGAENALKSLKIPYNISQTGCKKVLNLKKKDDICLTALKLRKCFCLSCGPAFVVRTFILEKLQSPRKLHAV